MFDSGTGPPATVGFPPVKFRIKSPTSSVMPSERTSGGTPAFALHTNAGLGVAALAGALPRASSRAVYANVKNHLRDTAISFSLCELDIELMEDLRFNSRPDNYIGSICSEETRRANNQTQPLSGNQTRAGL